MAKLFLSDLHLSASRPSTVAQFEGFLAGPALDAREIYILGDLFEYWPGDDDLADPFNARIVAALAGASARVPIGFMRGNRDFLIADGFARASGVSLIDDPLTIRLAGRKAVLLHGDTLCTDDTDYQRFRSESRSPAWIKTMLGTPLAVRKRHIQTLRDQSEAQKRAKSAGIMDVNAEAVATCLRAAACDLMIHGHTHRPAVHRLLVDGRPCERWVLDAWYEHGSYLAHDGETLQAHALP